ncbi:unnamed protein product, partial [Rotaria sordida]
LRFVHECNPTDQVLEKIKLDYVKQIESLKEQIANEQLEEFIRKYNQNESCDKQTKFLNIITSNKKNEIFIEVLYHLENSIKFQFEHEEKLSETIAELKSLNENNQFYDIIRILEEHENTLFVTLINSLYRPILGKQISSESILSNNKKDIIHQYELDSHVKDKKYKELQKKSIELYLEKFDQVLLKNCEDGDLFYQYRIQIFNNLLKDTKEKNSEEIEKTLASHLNQQIFSRLKKNNVLKYNIIDSNRLVTIPSTRVKTNFLSIKKLDYFFDKNGRFLIETAKKLNEYSVEVTLGEQKRIYDFSWHNSDQFDENYQMLNDLYTSCRIELFQKAIHEFNHNFTEKNLIEITKHFTYLFRLETLIRLNTKSQIDTIINFLKEFYSIIVDAMFPNTEDQLIISDFILALNSFVSLDDNKKNMKN